MAISVILAINASFLLAMTVVPALTVLLRGKPKVAANPFRLIARNLVVLQRTKKSWWF